MIYSRRLLFRMFAAVVIVRASALPQPQQAEGKLAGNAALRYWSAFAQMRDSSITPEEARQLQSVLDGTAAYSEAKYRDIVARNRPAVETLLRGTALPECDWGLEYELGSQAPIEHVRRALALGRVDVLYSYQQLATGDRTGAIQTLAAGIRFSHDVATGGPLMAALAAKTLILSHLRALDAAARMQPLSMNEKTLLSTVFAGIGPAGLDWRPAIQREFEVLSRSESRVPSSIGELYRGALVDSSRLSELERAIASAPRSVAKRIPNPSRVLEQKRELSDRLQQSRNRIGY